VSDENGLADFELLRGRRHEGEAVLCAFDLLKLDDHDLRREPIEARKAELAELLAGGGPGLVLNDVPGIFFAKIRFLRGPCDQRGLPPELPPEPLHWA